MPRDIILAFAATLAACLTGSALHVGLGGAGNIGGAMQNAVISAIFYTPACAFIGIAACRLFTSPLALTILSAVAAATWTAIKTARASPLKTVQMYGQTLYVDGQATLAGYAYETVTPFAVMALGGMAWMVMVRLCAAGAAMAGPPEHAPRYS